MTYFLDTNICIHFLKGKYRSIADTLRKKKPDEIKIASMVKAELLLGVEKSEKKRENRQAYERFLEPFEIVAFNDTAATYYAKVRFDLEKSGRIIGSNDLIIAATVLAQKGILVTHNTGEFGIVAGLPIEDWVVSTLS